MKFTTIASLLLLAAFGFVLGFALVLLLPAVFLTWLRQWLADLRPPSPDPEPDAPTPLLEAIDRERWIDEIEAQLSESRGTHD